MTQVQMKKPRKRKKGEVKRYVVSVDIKWSPDDVYVNARSRSEAKKKAHAIFKRRSLLSILDKSKTYADEA